MEQDSQSSSSSHLVISIVVLLVVAVGAFYFYNNKLGPRDNFVYEMSAITIKEVRENAIVVEGKVKPKEPETMPTAPRRITFIINPKTTFKKSTLGATAEQIASGESFKPQTIIEAGQMEDIDMTSRIVSITSTDDLTKESEAAALEINYLLYDLEYPEIN